MSQLFDFNLASNTALLLAAGAAFILNIWYVAAILSEVPVDGHFDTQICGRNIRVFRNKSEARAIDLDEGGRPVPCRVSEGLIWIFARDKDGCDREVSMDVPRFGGPKGRVKFMEKVIIPAHQDDAIYGLLDPAHTPFVHRSPLWRGNGILKEKTKTFEPTELGFTMTPHAPVNSDIYKIIGGAVSVRIAFRIPGLRAEYISNTRHTVLGLTALTPVDERHTVLRQTFYWDTPVLDLIRPFARLIARPFLQQDVNIMALRRQNEAFQGKGMLLGDSDQQFLWYLQLKKAWAACGFDPQTFQNPLKPATLRWRT